MEIEDCLNSIPRHSISINLDRIKEETKRLCIISPTFNYIQIAGTKGKGSTAVFLQNILIKSGLKVGLFISPHLVSINERISINSELIDDESLEQLYKKVSKTLNFFETLFVIAMLYFEKERVDIAILETGLGGRLDPTNSLNTLPLLSIITTIGMDHLDILGDTIEEIAHEKAGIIKRGVDVITSPQREEVLNIIIDKAKDMNSRIYRIDTKCSIITKEVNNIEFEEFSLYSNISDNFYKDLRIRLSGKHQLINANLALCAVEILQTRGYRISEQDIRDGLLDAFLPGRFQIFKISDKNVVLDGAHNPESSKSLYVTLNNKFNRKKVIYILTTLKNKLAEEIISNLISNSKIFLFTELSECNSYSAKELKDILEYKSFY